MSKPEFEFFPVTEVPYTVCPGDDPKITERVYRRKAERAKPLR